jgi:hypothetical protein
VTDDDQEGEFKAGNRSVCGAKQSGEKAQSAAGESRDGPGISLGQEKVI